MFVAVADGKGGQIQPMVLDLGEICFTAKRWHRFTIMHKRSSGLLFNKDQLEV